MTLAKEKKRSRVMESNLCAFLKQSKQIPLKSLQTHQCTEKMGSIGQPAASLP